MNAKRTRKRRPTPVVSMWVPTVVCSVCRVRVANPDGDASGVLTEHYRRAHTEALDEGKEA